MLVLIRNALKYIFLEFFKHIVFIVYIVFGLRRESHVR